jgi:hypothetical protein
MSEEPENHSHDDSTSPDEVIERNVDVLKSLLQYIRSKESHMEDLRNQLR